MRLNVKTFLDKILKIITFGLVANSILFSMDNFPSGKREWSSFESISSEEDLPFNNDEYFSPPVFDEKDEKLNSIKIMYGEPMIRPDDYEFKNVLKENFPEFDSSEQEEEYTKEINNFEKRNQMLEDMNLLEPVAKLYYVDRKIYSQTRNKEFKETNRLNLNDLGLELEEIDNVLSFFDDIQNLENAVDFSYTDPYVSDDLEKNIYPIVKIINIYQYFISYLDDLNYEKYIKKAASFLENLRFVYFEYIKNNNIDINNKLIKSIKNMFCSIADDIENLEQLMFAKKFEQVLELLNIDGVARAIGAFYEKYNYDLDFSDSEEIVLNLIKNKKINNVIDSIFNRISFEDSNVIKKGLVKLLLKIEEVLIDEIDHTKENKDKQKELIEILKLIFSNIANWNEDNLDSLNIFLSEHILEKLGNSSILQKIVNNKNLNLFIDKFKDLINRYAELVKMIDVNLLMILDYVGDLAMFNGFVCDIIFDLVFIDHYEFDENDCNNDDILEYVTNFRNSLVENKTRYESWLDESFKIIKFDIDLSIKNSENYNEINETTIKMNVIDLGKDLLLLRFRAVLYFFGYVVEYLSEKDSSKQTIIYNKFKQNRGSIGDIFDQILDNANECLSKL
ncbi:MAG: hypothetical protein SZ59_C0002G0340 [candidate division TM6 bacterium GW2011_GWF2_28_16]|nr:MAG: hypothetical protein SZ59_C0002G0340 [candidate division TM6 bacterium GW2011_GWF2_28_16]